MGPFERAHANARDEFLDRAAPIRRYPAEPDLAIEPGGEDHPTPVRGPGRRGKAMMRSDVNRVRVPRRKS